MNADFINIFLRCIVEITYYHKFSARVLSMATPHTCHDLALQCTITRQYHLSHASTQNKYCIRTDAHAFLARSNKQTTRCYDCESPLCTSRPSGVHHCTEPPQGRYCYTTYAVVRPTATPCTPTDRVPSRALFGVAIAPPGNNRRAVRETHRQCYTCVRVCYTRVRVYVLSTTHSIVCLHAI